MGVHMYTNVGFCWVVVVVVAPPELLQLQAALPRQVTAPDGLRMLPVVAARNPKNDLAVYIDTRARFSSPHRIVPHCQVSTRCSLNQSEFVEGRINSIAFRTLWDTTGAVSYLGAGGCMHAVCVVKPLVRLKRAQLETALGPPNSEAISRVH
jgi:hypothetical protein